MKWALSRSEKSFEEQNKNSKMEWEADWTEKRSSEWWKTKFEGFLPTRVGAKVAAPGDSELEAL